MLDTQPLTLAHPAVQAAKADFEKGRYQRKLRYSFDELFEFFKADCVRFSVLESDSGVTHQRLHQIYDRYFRELLENKTGVERREACTLESRLIKIKQAEGALLESPGLKAVIEKARAAGCEIEVVPKHQHGKLSGGVLTRILLVNKHRCAFHLARRVWKHSPGTHAFYAPVQVSYRKLVEVDAALFHVAAEGYPERIFVVPSALLREKVFGSSPKKMTKTVYLPCLKVPVYHNNYPCIDYWEYEDAWHLLPPKTNPPVP